MRIMKKFAVVLLIFSMLATLLTACAEVDDIDDKTDDPVEGASNYEVTNVYDYVVDAGTITEIDYDYISEKYANGNDLGGGCSAIAKVTDDGTMLVGRNMDLYFSNNPAYIVRTAVEGCYETIGVAYSFQSDWPTYEQVLAEGLSEEKYKELPFITTDIMNSEGLFVEINMRNAEFWVSGDSKFACSGTNENAEERVYSQCLTRYIAEHCANVDEAVEYVNNLDIFTGNTKNSWNFCFVLADESGHYGLLEIANNKVAWNDYQPCQTNFYIDKELAAMEEYKCGLGRYDYLMSHIDAVQTEKEMHDLMDEVSYFGIYSEDCPYDMSSELVGTYPYWTNAYMSDEANREEIEGVIAYYREAVAARSEQELRDRGTSWLSVFTTVANCSEKTLNVRFFEKEAATATISFD